MSRYYHIIVLGFVLLSMTGCIGQPSSPSMDAMLNEDEKVGMSYIDNPENLKPDQYGNHPIHYITDTGNMNHLRALLDKGVDVDVKNPNGATLFSGIVSKPDFQPWENLAEYLVDNGANVNLNVANYPLICYPTDMKAVDFLIAKGANLDNASSCFNFYTDMMILYKEPSPYPDANGNVNFMAVMAQHGDSNAIAYLRRFKNSRVQYLSIFKEMPNKGIKLEKYSEVYEQVLEKTKDLKDEEFVELRKFLTELD